MYKISILALALMVLFSLKNLSAQIAAVDTAMKSERTVGSAEVTDHSEKIKMIKSILAEHADNRNFEGSVLIAEKGIPVYENTFGFRDREKALRIEPETRFGIASITKMITAIIILQLVEEGKLTLETTLDHLFPDMDIPKGNKITMHHLLLHISGLPNEPNNIYFTNKSPSEYVDVLMNGFRKNKRFGKFNYANIDYVLLGMAIEKASGNTWQQEVEQRFINKLGLEKTGFLEKDAYPENFAYSYTIEGGQFQKDPSFHIENFYAAGCMYSTATDLLKIDQAMYGNTLLSDTSKAQMFTSYPEYNYTGYSVWTYRYPFLKNQPRIMERRGGILGSNAALIRVLDQELSIIILSNNNAFNPDSFGDAENLRETLIRALATE